MLQKIETGRLIVVFQFSCERAPIPGRTVQAVKAKLADSDPGRRQILLGGAEKARCFHITHHAFFGRSVHRPPYRQTGALLLLVPNQQIGVEVLLPPKISDLGHDDPLPARKSSWVVAGRTEVGDHLGAGRPVCQVSTHRGRCSKSAATGQHQLESLLVSEAGKRTLG